MTYFKRLTEWFKRLLIWIYNIYQWLINGKYFWGFIVLILFFIPFNRYYLYIGTGLQLLGIITILIGINNKIKLFKKENPLKHFLKYFTLFPRFKRKAINIYPNSGVITMTSYSPTISIGVKRPTESFEDIIRYVDEKLNGINDQISYIQTEQSKQIDDLKKQLENQRQQLDSNINDVKTDLLLSSMSDISIELFGAGSIAAGLIFSILPELLK